MIEKDTKNRQGTSRRSSEGAARRMRVIHGQGQEQEAGPSWSLAFAETARQLGVAVQGQGLVMPAFRSPPREVGRRRTLIRHGDGSATVSVLIQNRSWPAVMADMIEGVVVVNRMDGLEAEALRDQLWEALEGEAPSEDAAA